MLGLGNDTEILTAISLIGLAVLSFIAVMAWHGLGLSEKIFKAVSPKKDPPLPVAPVQVAGARPTFISLAGNSRTTLNLVDTTLDGDIDFLNVEGSGDYDVTSRNLKMTNKTGIITKGEV